MSAPSLAQALTLLREAGYQYEIWGSTTHALQITMTQRREGSGEIDLSNPVRDLAALLAKMGDRALAIEFDPTQAYDATPVAPDTPVVADTPAA
jgi:hypothetical protein